MTAPTEHPDIAKLKAELTGVVALADAWRLPIFALNVSLDRAYAIGLAQLPPEIDRLAREWVEADGKWLTWSRPDLELRRLGYNKARAQNKLLHALRGLVTR